MALDGSAKGRRLREGPCRQLWIRPAAGVAGSALGAALAVWHRHVGQPRPSLAGTGLRDRQRGSYLGPDLDPADTRALLQEQGAVWRELPDRELLPELARPLPDGPGGACVPGPVALGPGRLGVRSSPGAPRPPR